MARVMADVGLLRGCRVDWMISVYLVVSVILHNVAPEEAKEHLGLTLVGSLIKTMVLVGRWPWGVAQDSAFPSGALSPCPSSSLRKVILYSSC